MLWLMEALVTGLEAFYIQWDNRPMKQFRTNYPPSVSLGALWFPINIILFIFFFPENWKLVFMVCYLLLIQLFSLAVIYGAGLVTSLSPCTLSVLPLTLGYIGKLCFEFSVSKPFKMPKSVGLWQGHLALAKAKQR